MTTITRFFVLISLCLMVISASAMSPISPPPSDSTRFALELYDQVRDISANQLFSPYSITTAFLMAYAGADGATARQMREVLHLLVPDDLLAQTVANYAEHVLTRNNAPESEYEAERTFAVANALWIQNNFELLPAYPQTLTDFYNASITPLDFVNAPEDARETINQAIEEQTRDRITNLIPPGVINELTRLILTNAVYFKAEWAKQFTKASTPYPFTLLDDTQVDAPFIAKRDRLPYLAGDDFIAVAIPYAGWGSQMVIVLPDDFEAYLTTLSEAGLPDLYNQPDYKEVILSMPTFQFESAFSLSDALVALGMTDAFTPDVADFSGMTGDTSLYIQDALHKAFIAVDENGTEAAAATAIIIGVTSMPIQEDPIPVLIDKPFLFYIQDTVTGEVLFMGHVVNPVEG